MSAHFWPSPVNLWFFLLSSLMQTGAMRTTIRLDDDVAASAEKLRRERHIGLGEAVNELARAGMAAIGSGRTEFVQQTASLGLKVDVSNVAEALDLLDSLDDPA